MIIVCPYRRCGREVDKPAGAVNRARAAGLPIYCSMVCSRFARRIWKSDQQKKLEKTEYDRVYRAANQAALKEKKAARHKQTYDPAKAAVERQAGMPRHVEYCRQPEYKKKKIAYDRKRRAAEYGDFAEAFLLLQGIDQEIRERSTKSEIYQENGRTNNATKRKRAAARGSVAVG